MVYGRDTQRQKVYDFETEFVAPKIKNVSLSLEECRVLIKSACSLYNLSSPKVLDGRGRATACWTTPGIWDDAGGTIKLPLSGRKPTIALHEAAHRIACHYDNGQGGHGPTFVRVLLDLLTHFYPELSLRALRAELTARHIKVSPPGVCPMYKGADLRTLAVLRERKRNLEAQLKEVGEQITEVHKRNRPTDKPAPGRPKSKLAASR